MAQRGLVEYFDAAIQQVKAHLDGMPVEELSRANVRNLSKSLRDRYGIPLLDKDSSRGVKVKRPRENAFDFELRYFVNDSGGLEKLGGGTSLPRPSRWAMSSLSQQLMLELVRADAPGESFVANFDGSVALAKNLVSFIDSYVLAINEDILLLNKQLDEHLERVVAQFVALAKHAGEHRSSQEKELRDAGFSVE